MNRQQWSRWLNWNKVIPYNLTCVQLAGEIKAGIVLSVLIFGREDYRRWIERDDEMWLPKTYAEWSEDTGLMEAPLRRAFGKLEKKGLVKVRVWQFEGQPTLHISLSWEAVLPFLPTA